MIYCGYIKLDTLEYPKYIQDILYEHPDIEHSNVEFGEFPHPATYALVRSTLPPEHDFSTHKAEVIQPVFREGEWYQNWEVVPLTEQEISDNAARFAEMQEKVMQAQAELAANEARAASGDSGTTVLYI
jgi:hypothetical protein